MWHPVLPLPLHCAPGRYKKLLIVTTVMARSLDMLALVTFLVSMVVVIAATLMYFAERGERAAAVWSVFSGDGARKGA